MDSFWPIRLTVLLVGVCGAKSISRTCNYAVDLRGTLLPTFFLHGLQGDASSGAKLQRYLNGHRSPTYFCSIPLFEGLDSQYTPLSEQVPGVMAFIREKADNFRDEHGALLNYQVVCHSMGGFMCRQIVQQMDDHRIVNLVTLASPLAGLYVPHKKVPVSLQAVPGYLSKKAAAMAVRARMWGYKNFVERWTSAFAMWNNPMDPKENQLIWKLDGHQGEDETEEEYHERIARERANWGRLKKATFLNTDQECLVFPHQSAHFGFFRPNSTTVLEPWATRHVADHLQLHQMRQKGNLNLWTFRGRDGLAVESHFYFITSEKMIRWYVSPALMNRDFTLNEYSAAYECTRDDQCALAHVCTLNGNRCVHSCYVVRRAGRCAAQAGCRWIDAYRNSKCRKTCRRDADCDSNERCKRHDNICVKTCKRSADCEVDEVCAPSKICRLPKGWFYSHNLRPPKRRIRRKNGESR